MGIPPVEALLHIRTLSLFRSIIAAEVDSPPSLFIRELICRQLAMRDPESSSWAAHVKHLLHRYGLPSAYSLVCDPPGKTEWKKAIKDAVHGKWTKDLQDEARTKTTLRYIKLESCSTRKLHPVWQQITCPLTVKKACIKAMVMVQRYPLSTSPTSGVKRSDMCPLCSAEPETTTHFLLHCSRLSAVRAPYMTHIMSTCRQQKVDVEPENITRIILDSQHLPDYDPAHEINCRNFVFKMHSKRSVMLGGDSAYKW